MVTNLPESSKLSLNENDFSNFGRYVPKDKLILNLPNNAVTISCLDEAGIEIPFPQKTIHYAQDDKKPV